MSPSLALIERCLIYDTDLIRAYDISQRLMPAIDQIYCTSDIDEAIHIATEKNPDWFMMGPDNDHVVNLVDLCIQLDTQCLCARTTFVTYKLPPKRQVAVVSFLSHRELKIFGDEQSAVDKILQHYCDT